tara:strand:+ start:19598 stop:22783 length:3186 start_codon:yes stop_codon:yes gene_type:complete
MNMFKSVNIADDLGRAEVVDAYRPTRKTLQVVRAICGLDGSRATHVIAPYGAGKSIAALAGIKCLTGTAETNGPLIERIRSMDSALASALCDMADGTKVCLLHGASADIGAALCEQLGMEPQETLAATLKALIAHARRTKTNRIVIVWDEFGQHLETLVREGRAEDLLALQDLAEWAVRRSNPTVTLTTLMHQGVHSFARRVSETAQSAWRKIEGRFDTLSLVDDGIDVYEMLAEALQGDRGDSSDIAQRARAAGFFQKLGDEKLLDKILSQTAPLTLAAVDVLPRLSAQVAQNERTMMRFVAEVLSSSEPGVSVGLPALYDYFAPAMRADRGPGGTHRRLIEAESALSRANGPLQRDIIKSVTLLQLGGASERLRLPLARLLFALAEGTGVSVDDAQEAIAALVDRKVLLHRRRIDDVSVWHGADIDLSGMIAEEAAGLSIEQDVIATLERLFPADAYTAPLYNYERSITRFARARFVLASDLLDEARSEELQRAADMEDAFVALVIDGTLDRADLIDRAADMPRHFITALPRRSTEVAPIVADLLAIETLLERTDLLESDPLVERELIELRAEVETSLRQALDRLMNPDRGEVIWWADGKDYDFGAGATHGDLLTQIFEARFPLTPRIRNEQIVRRTVTSVSRSARKRCILGVIERSGSPSLGYESSTSADASIFRTVFERTGLYRKQDNGGDWATSQSLKDPGLSKVWSILETFFVKPKQDAKSFVDLFDRLIAPPVGLREGLLPLLVAAGLRAFGRHLALRQVIDGRPRYVDDINPSIIERICDEPARFELMVVGTTGSELRTLEKFVVEVAGQLDPHEHDLVRAFYDGLLAWKAGLPPSALFASGLGENADRIQPLLRRRNFDPLQFLFQDLPAATNAPPLSKQSLQMFVLAMSEIEGVAKSFALRAEQVAKDLFNSRTSGEPLELIEAATVWAKGLPITEDASRALDQEARGILSRAKAAKSSSRGGLRFVTTLSGILSGTGFSDWDEDSVKQFRERLSDAISRVEDLALLNADGSEEYEPFLKSRISLVIDQFGEKIGRDKLMEYLQDLYREAK